MHRKTYLIPIVYPVCLFLKTDLDILINNTDPAVFGSFSSTKYVPTYHFKDFLSYSCNFVLLVCFDALRPSQQFFSHVGAIPCRPGLNQYKAADSFLLKDTTQ